MILNSIASVRTGLILSRKEAKTAESCCEYRQLNLKAIDDNGRIDLGETVPFYTSEELSDNYLTRIGDIIVKTTEPYTAVYITEEYTDLVIPSHFVLIRDINEEVVLPQYISWYLNTDRIKKMFRMSSTGSLKQIRPAMIGEVEIKPPTIERQKQVIELHEYSCTEIQLLEKLIELKKIYYKVKIDNVNRTKA